jgi:hypothetical protein
MIFKYDKECSGEKFAEKNVLFHTIIRKRTIFEYAKSIKNVPGKKRVLKKLTLIEKKGLKIKKTIKKTS